MLNIKGKYISLSILSAVIFVVFIMAIVLSVTGTLTETVSGTTKSYSMDSTLKLAAGLWGMFIVLWFWNAALTIPALRWSDKSSYLTTTLWTTLVAPLLTWILGIVAISTKKFQQETAKKKEVANE